MTNKPISWAEIQAIFDRCGEIHLSPNLAEGLAAQGMRPRENAKRSRAKPRSPVVASGDDAPNEHGLKPGSPDEG